MNSLFPSVQAEISLRPPFVHYVQDGKELTFLIRDIRMIGEFTTAPDYLDIQYFFVFQLRGQADMVEVPASCEQLFPVLNELRKHLSDLATPRLQISEGNDSNILFPKSLAGKKLYRFQSESRPWINLPLLRNIGQIEQVKRTRINY